MSRRPKRDVFEFSNGRQILMNDLPDQLIFDVLVVPGSEQDPAFLNTEPAVMEPTVQDEEESEKEPLLARLLARF